MRADQKGQTTPVGKAVKYKSGLRDKQLETVQKLACSFSNCNHCKHIKLEIKLEI